MPGGYFAIELFVYLCVCVCLSFSGHIWRQCETRSRSLRGRLDPDRLDSPGGPPRSVKRHAATKVIYNLSPLRRWISEIDMKHEGLRKWGSWHFAFKREICILFPGRDSDRLARGGEKNRQESSPKDPGGGGEGEAGQGEARGKEGDGDKGRRLPIQVPQLRRGAFLVFVITLLRHITLIYSFGFWLSCPSYPSLIFLAYFLPCSVSGLHLPLPPPPFPQSALPPQLPTQAPHCPPVPSTGLTVWRGSPPLIAAPPEILKKVSISEIRKDTEKFPALIAEHMFTVIWSS